MEELYITWLSKDLFVSSLAISEDDCTEANRYSPQRCGHKAFARYCIPNFIVKIKVNMVRVVVVLCSVKSWSI